MATKPGAKRAHEKAKRAARRFSTAVSAIRNAYKREIALLNRLALEAREAGDRAQAVGFDTSAYVMSLRLRAFGS